MAATVTDIRERFERMAPEALLVVDELAQLLCTTRSGIWQMAHRRELPPTAFPGKRRSVWFVGDIRNWLKQSSASRTAVETDREIVKSVAPRSGRPRLPVSN